MNKKNQTKNSIVHKVFVFLNVQSVLHTCNKILNTVIKSVFSLKQYIFVHTCTSKTPLENSGYGINYFHKMS